MVFFHRVSSLHTPIFHSKHENTSAKRADEDDSSHRQSIRSLFEGFVVAIYNVGIMYREDIGVCIVPRVHDEESVQAFITGQCTLDAYESGNNDTSSISGCPE